MKTHSFIRENLEKVIFLGEGSFLLFFFPSIFFLF